MYKDMAYADTFAEYTERRAARAKFVADHAEVLKQLAALDTELADFEGLLKEEARTAGKGIENDHFLVVVQNKSRRVYDPVRIFANIPNEETREVIIGQGGIEVNAKKLDELITAGAVTPAVLEGAISEEPLTPAVTIKEKEVTDGR